MAAPDNWEQFNEDMRQWQQQAQDLALTYRGLVDVAASGELGALAFIESLSEAPIGDRAALQQTLQVQNVAGRGVVGGSGGLMAQGAFGLGGQGTTPPNDDLLLDADNGIYRLTSSNTGVDSASGDILIRGKFGSNNNNRLLLLGAGPLISPVLRLRVQSAFGGWGDTATFFHNQNILGTVSQLDGVPTGAIIERGENANGQYVKFADGSVFMQSPDYFVDIDIASGSVFRSPTQTWTFPVETVSADSTMTLPSAQGNSATHWTSAISFNNISANITGFSGNQPTNRTLRAMAFGRWYE